MKVVITDKARQDLFAFGDHIAKSNPLRAFSFMEELEVSCFSLGDFPNSHAILRDYPEFGVRRAVHGNYSIFYIVTDAVYVIHIFNSAVDYERILFPRN